jgi:hypothetical protein
LRIIILIPINPQIYLSHLQLIVDDDDLSPAGSSPRHAFSYVSLFAQSSDVVRHTRDRKNTEVKFDDVQDECKVEYSSMLDMGAGSNNTHQEDNTQGNNDVAAHEIFIDDKV